MPPFTHPDDRAQRDFFDAHALQWDLQHQEKLPLIRSILRELDFRPGSVVIEPGCGTGLITQVLQELAGHSCRLYSFDTSPAMLAQARRKFPASQYYYLQADGHAMPFISAGADTVLCFAVFPHFTDRSAALRECRRVLKTGGRLMIAHALSKQALNSLHTNAGAAVAQDRLPENTLMRSMMESCGFSVLSLTDGIDRYVVQAEAI